MLWTTVAAALLPGAGHALCGRWDLAAAVFVSMAAGIAAAVVHLWLGIYRFETPLGAFLFTVLLRGLAILHAFSVIDAHGRAARPADQRGARVRLAVALNLLVPGAGYLVARAWLRAATGFALLALILIFAKAGSHRFLDLIYVGLQLLMGAFAYHQTRGGGETEGAAPSRAAPPADVPAQVVALVVVVAAVVFCGTVVERVLPAAVTYGPLSKDLRLQKTKSGTLLTIPRLGLSLTASGPGWTLRDQKGAFVFVADHPKGASLMLGVPPIPPFVKRSRCVPRIREWLEGQGLVHQKTLEVTLNGAPAVQMRFSGDFPSGPHIDHWAIAVPRKGFAYLLMMYCARDRCSELAPLLEQSRDSFTLAAGP
jgi:hypothetical protein